MLGRGRRGSGRGTRDNVPAMARHLKDGGGSRSVLSVAGETGTSSKLGPSAVRPSGGCALVRMSRAGAPSESI